MKNFYFLFVLINTVLSSSAQNSIYLEDFEGATPSVTSYSSLGSTTLFGINTTYSVSGSNSYNGVVITSDTLFLETSTINATSSNFLTLSFNQICKIDFFDKAIIQVSNDNGSTWTTLGSNEYNGTGFLNANGFSSISYSDWDAANGSSIPANSWWKSESFDITAIAAGNSQVKIRFGAIDADNNGPRSNYGWILDDINVIEGVCELIPPTIVLMGNIFQGKVYNTGPFTVEADITDASGVDSAFVNYSSSSGASGSVLMTRLGGNIFRGDIPSAIVGDTICYSISAVDSTTCRNIANNPSSGCIQFDVNSNPPPTCSGTPVFNFNYNETFATFNPGNGSNSPGVLANDWENETSGDNHDWWVYDQGTNSGQTGPSNDHSPLDANYMYVESSGGFANTTAILNTPCYDFTNLLSPKFRFWYHMYGNQMGSLHLDIFLGGQWVLDIMPSISGDQGDQWLFNEVDLTAYAGNIVKLRFRANVGVGFRSDIAIDDIEIFEPVGDDIAINNVVSPNPLGCSGSANEFVTVELENLGGNSQSEIPLAYVLNGGTIIRDTARINMAPGTKANHTFQQSINMSAPGSYSFDVWNELQTDGNSTNDSIFNYAVASSSIQNSFADTTNFDNFLVGFPGTFQDGWANSQLDAHDWYVNSGGTPSNQTGPSGDNTSGGGNYLFVEATNFNNLEATLFSKCYDISNLNMPELTFSYHMSGIEMGELHVDVIINGFEIRDVIAPFVGDQGPNWNTSVIDLSAFKGVVKIALRGMTGNGYRSDIAIDDFSIRDAAPVGIEEKDKKTELSLFPNPAKNNVLISSSNKINRIELVDITGKSIRSFDSLNQKMINLDLTELGSGIYFVSVFNELGIETKKLIVE